MPGGLPSGTVTAILLLLRNRLSDNPFPPSEDPYCLSMRARTSWIWRHPRITIGLTVIVATIGLDFLLANVLMLLGLYAPQHKIESYYRIRHDAYNHTLAPNIDFSEGRWGPIGYRMDTNSLGFKDRSARSLPLTTERYRILFIGDSFTEGVGIEYADTFVGIVHALLEKKEIDTLNAAAASYSPIIYLRKVQHLLNDVGLEFDHLVVCIDLSDITDEVDLYKHDKQGNVVLQSPPGLGAAIKHFMTENTILLSNIRILFRVIKKSAQKDEEFHDALNRKRGRWSVDENAFEAYARAGLSKAARHMDELFKLLQRQGIALSVVVYPWPDQIFHRDLHSKQVAFWEEWTDRHEVQFINLFPAFIHDRAPRAVIEEFYIKGDIHWNEAGHSLVAEELLKQLDSDKVREQGLLR